MKLYLRIQQGRQAGQRSNQRVRLAGQPEAAPPAEFAGQ